MARYNETRYNENQYNYNQLGVDSFSVADSTVERSFFKRLSSTIFAIDVLTKQIINKGLFDILRPSGWLSKNRVDETTWSD